MHFRLSNLLVTQIDNYLVNQPYKDVNKIIATLQRSIKSELGEKNDKGQRIIKGFHIDSQSLTELINFLKSRPYSHVENILNSLKSCEIAYDIDSANNKKSKTKKNTTKNTAFKKDTPKKKRDTKSNMEKQNV